MHGASALLRVAATSSIRKFTTKSHGLIGPAVKLLFYHYGLTLKDVNPTGPKNNVLKSDVMRIIEARHLKPMKKCANEAGEGISSATTPPKGSERFIGGYIDIPLTDMRNSFAKRLSRSKQNIPHEYMTASVVLDEVSNFRCLLKDDGIDGISINDIMIKAVGDALRAVPEINVTWERDSVVSHRAVNVSVAISTPIGLVTPIVFNADTKGVLEISQTMGELITKAKENRLAPNELQGGTFTITNLGMFDSVTDFTAIINEPQAAILTVGSPMYEINERNKMERRCIVTLCYDVRAVSFYSARSFITHLSQSLNRPLFTTLASDSINEHEFEYANLL